MELSGNVFFFISFLTFIHFYCVSDLIGTFIDNCSKKIWNIGSSCSSLSENGSTCKNARVQSTASTCGILFIHMDAQPQAFTSGVIDRSE